MPSPPRYDLPRTLTLPSGLRVRVDSAGPSRGKPAEASATIFDDVLGLFARGEVTLEAQPRKARGGDAKDATGKKAAKLPRSGAVDVLDLSLADFHVLRAVLTKAGLLDEEKGELDCHNCGARIVVDAPSARLETGPWEDDEANDEELDALAPVDEPLDLAAPIAIGRVRRAHTVTFEARSVRHAMPLFQAVSRDPIAIDERFVTGMGLRALGPRAGSEAAVIRDPARIAAILRECGDAELDAVAHAFFAVHYPLRLACDVFCPECKARNTIELPQVRELDVSPAPSGDEEDDEDEPAREGDFTALPKLEVFVELAHAIAEPLLRDIPGRRVELVVEDGTPAVDDGGEPLLGAYDPPPPEDAPVPMRPPRVTVYYRTFEMVERTEGRFDWEDELRETIEHELEHHIYFLRGDDPMDEAEHAEIDREVVRVVGQREATRRTLVGFGHSIPDFFRRAWPLVAIAAAVLAIALAEGRCAGAAD